MQERLTLAGGSREPERRLLGLRLLQLQDGETLLTTGFLRERDQAYRGLESLSEAGLAGVARSRGRPPIVTILGDVLQ